MTIRPRQFTNEQARQMREDYAAGRASLEFLRQRAQYEMAQEVFPTTIRQIVFGDSYKDAGGPIQQRNKAPKKKLRRGRRSHLSDEQISIIRARAIYGYESTNALAEEFDVHQATISQIKHGKTGTQVPECPYETNERIRHEKLMQTLEDIRKKVAPNNAKIPGTV